MEAKYYVAVRPRTNEMHGVHKEGCPLLDDDEKRIYLGTFKSGYDAETEGLRHFSKAKCCAFCAKELKAAGEDQLSLVPLGRFSAIRLIEVNSFFCSVN
jgi:hypothetical protein